MKHVKICREELGLTQQELAQIVGLSQETISQYEIGSRTPNIITAKKIADALNVSLDNIFFGNNISKWKTKISIWHERRIGGERVEREQITIRLPADLKERLQQEADERGYTLTNLIMFILWKNFEKTIAPE